MKIAQGADYGMAAIIYLSQKGEERRYSLREISQATQIPEEFLRKNIWPRISGKKFKMIFGKC